MAQSNTMGGRHGASSRECIIALVLLLALSFRTVVANSALSALKSAQSNPVLPVVVDGKRINLLLTTDMDGISLCEDRSATLPPSFNRIDHDYARKLLRYQLSGLTQLSAVVQLAIPSLAVESQHVPVDVFFLAQQSLSPTALAYFLHHSNADGFIGVGYAFRWSSSPFWPLLEPTFQYRMAMGNASHHTELETGDDDEEARTGVARGEGSAAATLHVSDFVAGQDESEQNEWDWSEPCASVDQADDLGRPNNQGLNFPVHHVRFQCTQQQDDAAPSRARDAFALHDVDMFGDFTSSWDAAVDFHSPCLVLPQQFYNSLAGWTGLSYDDNRKVSVIALDALLPSLSFALTHDGPRHALDLNRLLLNTSNSTTTAVCIQKSSSIVHNGASVFAPIETESTAQRYRLHGTMVLPVYNMQQAPIVFGTMVLRALGEMLVDGEAKQAAFPHPDQVRRPATAGVPVCQLPPECIGQQELSPRLNACLDPACESYYFQSLDPTTKICVINAGWLMFLYTTVAVFVAAELLLSANISRTIRNAIATTRDGGAT